MPRTGNNFDYDSEDRAELWDVSYKYSHDFPEDFDDYRFHEEPVDIVQGATFNGEPIYRDKWE